MKNKLTGLAAALTMTASSVAMSHATELQLFHSWSNESEINALNVFVSEFESRGHKITEMSVPHEQAGSSPLVSLVVAGTPPNVFLTGQADFYRDLRDRGIGQVVGPFFDEIGATENFPAIVLAAITVDGEVRKIPSGIHIDGILYYNMKVAEAAGVDPTSWTSIDEMFGDMAKVNDAGFTFMAMGGNSFQAGYLFHALLAGVAGEDIFYRFYRGTPDPTVFDEQGLRDTLETFRRITSQADEGWVNRGWNDTTNTVISGKALMHLHGDWMKGQWKATGKVLGEDYSCINLPGSKALSVTVDAMGILGGVSEEVLAAELEMASIVVDPVFNANFASFKGSTPVRIDAPVDKLDACNKLVLDSLQIPGFSVQNPFYIGDTDWINSVWNAVFTFQGDSDMTVDDVIATLKDEHAAIFD
ncbi:MAG: ABC transporter substrate-binding protein [Paracoccaceae bacterium]